MHLGPFCYSLKLGANRADRVQLMEKFVQVRMPYETRGKTGRIGAINAKIRAMKSRRKFSQQMQLIHIIRP